MLTPLNAFEPSRKPVFWTVGLFVNVDELREKERFSVRLTSWRTTRRCTSLIWKSRRPNRFVSGLAMSILPAVPGSMPIFELMMLWTNAMESGEMFSVAAGRCRRPGRRMRPPAGDVRCCHSGATKNWSWSLMIGPPSWKPYCLTSSDVCAEGDAAQVLVTEVVNRAAVELVRAALRDGVDEHAGEVRLTNIGGR